MTARFHHIGVVTKDISQALRLYHDLLGSEAVTEKIFDPNQHVNVQFLSLPGSASGLIELIEPVDGNSPVQTFLKSTGGGINHTCYEVDNLVEHLKIAKSIGAHIVQNPTPATAFGGRRISFIIARGFGLIEFLESEEK